MDIAKVKRAEKLIRRIEEIDSLVLKMEKISLVVLDQNRQLAIQIELIDDKPKEEVKQQYSYDWMGHGLLGQIIEQRKAQEIKEPEHLVKFNLKQDEMFLMFGFALQALNEERKELLKKIESL